MPGSEQPHVDYYFRKERLSDDGGERAHARIVEALPKAKAGGLLNDFRVMEHAEAFPTQVEELAVLEGLRKFSMVKRIALGRRFGSDKTHRLTSVVSGARAARECRRRVTKCFSVRA